MALITLDKIQVMEYLLTLGFNLLLEQRTLAVAVAAATGVVSNKVQEVKTVVRVSSSFASYRL